MESSLRDLQVVILCGGQGTRIRAVAEDRPKPMVEVGEKPILWHIMKYYSSFGVRRFVLALGHQGDRIVDYFANYRLRHHDFTMNTRDSSARLFHDAGGDDDGIENWEVTMAHTGAETMTGGRIKRVAPHIHGDTFFATYGDGVSNVDLAKLYAFHRAHGGAATLTGVHQPTTFGIVDADDSGRLQSFREKPTLNGYINGGFFVFNRSVFDEIKDDTTVLEDAPFRSLIQKGQLYMFRHDGFWQCMDHYKDYTTLNKIWASGRAPWKTR
ncbi:MAG TPA: glucose-1-phosphate cytidylyltransferase [Polyangia bacterium]|jgi:glucose-1-phosphate cytidylyltransferase|nr:glucose-1-phosphate cytidylyltransferase [Polyangia bacterium]